MKRKKKTTFRSKGYSERSIGVMWLDEHTGRFNVNESKGAGVEDD
jgi:hypothetical protein